MQTEQLKKEAPDSGKKPAMEVRDVHFAYGKNKILNPLMITGGLFLSSLMIRRLRKFSVLSAILSRKFSGRNRNRFVLRQSRKGLRKKTKGFRRR